MSSRQSDCSSLLYFPLLDMDRGQQWLYERHERPPRFALLLHGRLGPVTMPASRALRKRVPPSISLIELCAATHHSAIIHANLAAGGVAVFVHSWNPEEANVIDGLYSAHLRGSRHDAISNLTKAASHALSIGRAAQLARAYEVAHQHRFDLALTLRLDVAAFEPLMLGGLSTASPDTVWFARGCCASAADTPARRQLVHSRCGHGVSEIEGGPRKRVIDACRIDHHWRANRQRDPAVETAYHLSDFWFVASVRTALTWGRIARNWDWYVDRARALRISTLNPMAIDIRFTVSDTFTP